MDWIRAKIKDIPDFPREGVMFRDITPVVADAEIFRQAVNELAAPWKGKGIQKVVGIESRGWVFAAPIAVQLSAGLVLVRKLGALPRRTISEPYSEEHAVEMHQDALASGDKVLLVDDLLATGVTAAAACRLVQRAGAQLVGCAFLIELLYLNGRERLPNGQAHVLVKYAS